MFNLGKRYNFISSFSGIDHVSWPLIYQAFFGILDCKVDFTVVHAVAIKASKFLGICLIGSLCLNHEKLSTVAMISQL